MITPTAGPWRFWDRAFDACAPNRSNSENNVDWDALVTAILASGAAKPGYTPAGIPDWGDDEIEALWTDAGGIHFHAEHDSVRRFVNIVWLMHGTPWHIAMQDDFIAPSPGEMQDLVSFIRWDHRAHPAVHNALVNGDLDQQIEDFPERLIQYARRSSARARSMGERIRAHEGQEPLEAQTNSSILRSLAFRDPNARAWAWTGGLGDFTNTTEREVAWELANYVTAWLARRTNPDAPTAPEPEEPRSLATVIHDAILSEIAGRGQAPTVAMELTAQRASAAAITLITAAA